MPTCGLQIDFEQYGFEDEVWGAMKDHEQGKKMLALTEICVKIGKQYYVSDNNLVYEVLDSEKDARRMVARKWSTKSLNGYQIDMDMIDEYFDGDSLWGLTCPQLHAAICVPYSHKFIRYEGRNYLNIARDTIVEGVKENLPEGLKLLYLIYRSLCDGEELHEDEDQEKEILLRQVLDNDYSQLEFRFLMNWLAAICQRPGINLPTNVWLCGNAQGTGKGTLLGAMNRLLGDNYVDKVDAKTIQTWTKTLLGKLLIEFNEFDIKDTGVGSAGWEKWIKEITADEKWVEAPVEFGL